MGVPLILFVSPAHSPIGIMNFQKAWKPRYLSSLREGYIYFFPLPDISAASALRPSSVKLLGDSLDPTDSKVRKAGRDISSPV